jgi:hypothetical protein
MADDPEVPEHLRPWLPDVPEGLYTPAHLGRVWREYKEGRTFALREDRHLAIVMADHPEWADYWGLASDLANVRVRTPDGQNPYAAVMFEAVTEEMLEDGDPQELSRVYGALRRRGWTHAAARTELTRALQVVFGHLEPDEPAEAQLARILRAVWQGDRVEDCMPYRRVFLWRMGLGSRPPEPWEIEEAEARESRREDDEE